MEALGRLREISQKTEKYQKSERGGIIFLQFQVSKQTKQKNAHNI